MAKSTRLMLCVLFAVAVTVRLAFVCTVLRHPVYNPYTHLNGDMQTFVALGVSLAQGEGFSGHYATVLDEFLAHPDTVRPESPPTPTAKKAPGYPLFLALVFRIFGYDLEPVLFIQAILDAFSVLLVYGVGAQVGGRRTGLIAAVVSTIYYPYWFWAGFCLAETLLVFLTLLSFFCLHRWLGRPSWWTGLCAGLSAGFTILTKALLLPLIPFYLVGGWITQRRVWPLKVRGQGSVGVVVGLLLVLAPWMVRNYRHSGIPLLTPTYVGAHLLVGNNPAYVGANPQGFVNWNEGMTAIFHEARLHLPPSTRPILAEYLQDQAYRRTAWRYVTSHPYRTLALIPRKLHDTWRLDTLTANTFRTLSNLFCYGALIPFVFYGVWIALKRHQLSALPLASYLLYYVMVHAVLVGDIRYQLIAMPAIFLLGGFGLHEVWSRLPTRRPAV